VSSSYILSSSIKIHIKIKNKKIEILLSDPNALYAFDPIMFIDTSFELSFQASLTFWFEVFIKKFKFLCAMKNVNSNKLSIRRRRFAYLYIIIAM